MNKYRVIEIRKTEKGEEFVVETVYEARTKKKLRERIDSSLPSLVIDKNYRIKGVNCE